MVAKSLKHKFTSAVADDADASTVSPSQWNDDHDLWFGTNAISTATYTVAHTDHLSLLRGSYTGNTTFSVPAPTGGNMPSGWTVWIKNTTPAATHTITGTGGATFNGNASFTLAPSEIVELFSTGAVDYVATIYSRNTLTVGTTGIASGTSGRFLYDNAGVLGESATVLRSDATATLTVGFTFTAYSLGSISSGTLTPNAVNGNYQYLTCAGAFTLAAPSVDCAIDLLVTNGGAGGGAITSSGWTAANVGGDPYVTTANYKFLFSIRRIGGTAFYVIKALQ